MGPDAGRRVDVAEVRGHSLPMASLSKLGGKVS